MFKFTAEQVLTDREVRMLRRIGDGWADKEIAGDLSLSTKTVSNQLGALMQKLGAKNRAHAYSIALAMGALE